MFLRTCSLVFTTLYAHFDLSASSLAKVESSHPRQPGQSTLAIPTNQSYWRDMYF